MKCQSLKKNCRECGFKQDDKKLEICPNCGRDMHCGKDAVSGYTLCGNHGGPVPSRNFYGKGKITVTGTGSSFNIKNLASAYAKQMKDGNYLSNRRLVDILDTRMLQLLDRVDVGEAPDRLKILYGLWQDFKNTSPGTTDHLISRTELDAKFEMVFHDYKAWEQIFEAIDLRGKTVEREVKALTQIKAVMTAEDGYQLTAKLMGAVMSVIGEDSKKLKQVQYEFSRIIGESSDLATDGFGEDAGRDSETSGREEGPGYVDQAELLYTGDQE